LIVYNSEYTILFIWLSLSIFRFKIYHVFQRLDEENQEKGPALARAGP
jgi:hypothetical protein